MSSGLKHKNLGVFEWLLMVFILALVLLLLPISIWFCVKVVREHERAVIFRMGHLLQGRPRGPGLIFHLPLIDVCHKVDIRLKILKIPSHMAVTKDMVSVELTAACYYKIENVALCSSSLAGLTLVLQNLVQTLARDIVAQHTVTDILQHRKSIGQQMQAAVDSVACRWGVRVDRADIEELTFPPELQQSLTAEAELKRHQQDSVKMTDRDRVVCEMFRSSFRHLQPALVFPFPSDVFGATHDYSCLPPPPPPPSFVEQEERPAKELETDSSMM
ncbi:podocin [Synchiropus picturatus]